MVSRGNNIIVERTHGQGLDKIMQWFLRLAEVEKSKAKSAMETGLVNKSQDARMKHVT